MQLRTDDSTESRMGRDWSPCQVRTLTWRAEGYLAGALQCTPAAGFASEAQLEGEGEELSETNIDSEKKWNRVEINN